MAKFDGLEPRRCEDIKGIGAPEKARKVSGLLRKRSLMREGRRMWDLMIDTHIRWNPSTKGSNET